MPADLFATASTDELAQLVRELSNDNVKWDGTYVGLLPSTSDEQALSVVEAGNAVIPFLIDALQDATRFVVAHVLLTQLSNVTYAATPWNGLRVELNSAGVAQIDADQRFDLARRWRLWLQTQPHPHSLPE